MEAKEVSDELPVEGADTNDNKTRISLNKPVEDATKEGEERAIRVAAKGVSNKLPVLVEGVNTNDNKTWISLKEPAEDVTKESGEGKIGVEQRK